MTDRISGFLVILEEDLRDDDAEATLAAIRQIKGVIKVETIISTPEQHIAIARVKRDLLSKVYGLIANERGY